MNLKPFTVEVPYWSIDEDDQAYILFLAFLYKLGVAYGHSKLFFVYDADVRIMLGKKNFAPKLDLANKSWSRYLQVGQVLDEKSSFKMKNTNLNQHSAKRSITKELTDPRCQMIWIYLTGCFNNNLVEKADHKKRMGLDRVMKGKMLNGIL